MHATAEEAKAETQQMLNVYADCAEEQLAIPVIRGRKTDKEKFAGAEATYTIEAMMHDGKALQSGTSHYFGDGFARAFNITFTDKENKLQYPHQTSWGLSTRIIGGIIMTHGDDSGLVLPPAVAPIQVVVIPIAAHKGGVLEKAQEVTAQLISSGIRAKLDTSDNSAGWKFAEYEMKGVPLRIEMGPRDIEKGECVVVARDDRSKTAVPLTELTARLPEMLEAFRARIYDKALQNREARTRTAFSLDEMAKMAGDGVFIKTMWCGEAACEEKVKEVAGLTSRCMPFAQEHLGDVCPICGKPAKTMIVWGKAY
ncbi:Proline--tRNA ligase [bioreactor metagenome]|uniref:proline--tRNA ligase n=1 Tax=bioreactor metagenome TaxID=1076179 RepID=A0A644ZNQ2_9ZZZZ